MSNEKVQPFLPIWSRPPCKFLRYETVRFDDGCGHTGQLTIAHYIDKNKKEAQADAWIKWDKT